MYHGNQNPSRNTRKMCLKTRMPKLKLAHNMLKYLPVLFGQTEEGRKDEQTDGAGRKVKDNTYTPCA